MRTSITWALWASLALTALSLVLPQEAPAPTSAPMTSGSAHDAKFPTDPWTAVNQIQPAEKEPATALPAHLPRLELAAATRDIFRLARRPSTQIPPPPPLPTFGLQTSLSPSPSSSQIPVTSPTPALVAPVTTYRYGGRFETPDGRLLTFLAKGDQMIEVAAHQVLEDGWQVEAVETERIQLVYPSLKAHATIAIEPAQIK